MDKIEKYLNYAIFAFSLMVLVKTCGVSSDVKKIKKDIEVLTVKTQKMDSASIKKDDMVRLIKETPNWKTLEIEELSDKNKVPVNHYKNMDK